MPCSGETRFVKASRSASFHTDTVQVEYLVVTYAKDEPKVLLSLRQAEILAALAADQELAAKGGCVPALQDVGAHTNKDKS